MSSVTICPSNSRFRHLVHLFRRCPKKWTASRRNCWTTSIGITGRLESESVDDFDRNRWTTCPGILRVAAIRRKSDLMVRFEPNLSNSRSCSARSNFGCSSIGMSPISSRNRVPRSASSTLPIFLSNCAGEGTFLVTEELALQQSRRDGGAVQLHNVLCWRGLA